MAIKYPMQISNSVLLIGTKHESDSVIPMFYDKNTHLNVVLYTSWHTIMIGYVTRYVI